MRGDKKGEKNNDGLKKKNNKNFLKKIIKF